MFSAVARDKVGCASCTLEWPAQSKHCLSPIGSPVGFRYHSISGRPTKSFQVRQDAGNFEPKIVGILFGRLMQIVRAIFVKSLIAFCTTDLRKDRTYY